MNNNNYSQSNFRSNSNNGFGKSPHDRYINYSLLCAYYSHVSIRKRNFQKRKYVNTHTNGDSEGEATTNDPWIHLVDQLVEVNRCLSAESEKDFSFKCR